MPLRILKIPVTNATILIAAAMLLTQHLQHYAQEPDGDACAEKKPQQTGSYFTTADAAANMAGVEILNKSFYTPKDKSGYILQLRRPLLRLRN